MTDRTPTPEALEYCRVIQGAMDIGHESRACEILDYFARQARNRALRNLAAALQKWCPEAIEAIRAKSAADNEALDELLRALKSKEPTT